MRTVSNPSLSPVRQPPTGLLQQTLRLAALAALLGAALGVDAAHPDGVAGFRGCGPGQGTRRVDVAGQVGQGRGSEEGARVAFTWTSSGGAVNFDTHADRPGTPYHGYGKGTDTRVEGQLTAAFTGKHGWFWRNRTDAPITQCGRT